MGKIRVTGTVRVTGKVRVTGLDALRRRFGRPAPRPDTGNR
ncbi:hypothetical protein [Gordonia mangrovi]|nr:hypothetical protein [Gordonia mangrovi]MDY6809432.1 hypothetical protein [Actinomycetota bacterium]UVF78150.1 hypothetical protein NWF22_23500 [Gordonia mangrovi]